MTYTQPAPIAATTTVIGLSFELKSPRARVWRAITSEIAAWWPRDMHVGGADSRMSFDARLGGQLVEEWGSGAGFVWFSVIGIEPGASLDLAGHVTAKFGGPALSQLSIRLEEKNGATLLSIHDGVIGPLRPDTNRRITEGWSLIFGNALKRHLESAQ